MAHFLKKEGVSIVSMTDLMAKCRSNVNATMSKTEAHMETCTKGVESRPTSARIPENVFVYFENSKQRSS